MHESGLTRGRRRVAFGLWAFAAIVVAWVAMPDVPVVWGPRASAGRIEEGRELFVHDWSPHDELANGDGLGPVFNAQSCVACHFQGGVGGGGGTEHNVTSFEALPTFERSSIESGLIHKYAVANRLLESTADLRSMFPVLEDAIQVDTGCYVLTRDFDPLRTESINATALFGAGWIDRISSRAIVRGNISLMLDSIGRELQSDFTTMSPGRYRVLPDGRVGRFGWKAQFATLEEFVAAACANEIGLGNPKLPQATPRVDFEYPDVAPDLDRRQFGSLVAFVDTLPTPERRLPDDPAERQHAERGEYLFSAIGCAICHVPDVGGVEGIYSDFLLHRLVDRDAPGYRGETLPDVPIPREHPDADEWKTPPLWGVADSAPYFHDGASPNLRSAILRHEGDASPIKEAFEALSQSDQEGIVAFLNTLRAPSNVAPAPIPTTTSDEGTTLASSDY